MSDASEISVIGSVLLDDSLLNQIDLKPEEFDAGPTRQAWKAIIAVHAAGQPVDLVTVSSHPEGEGLLVYLSDWMRNTPSVVNALAYADLVRRDARQRRSIAILTETLERVRGGDTDAVSAAVAQLTAVSSVQTKWETTIAGAVDLLGHELDALVRGEAQGIPWMVNCIGHQLGVMRNTDLIVVGARPAMGKTAFLLNLLPLDIPCGVISGEMPAAQLAARMAAIHGDFDLSVLRSNRISGEQRAKGLRATTWVKNAPIHIYDRSNPSIGDVARIARRWKHQHGIKLLAVDYIQLMRTDGRSENDALRIEEIVKGLKNIARELEIPVLALAQVNRQVENREDKRPMPSDLKSSGAIEQEADLVISLYRDEVYNEGTPMVGIAEVIVGKNRHGMTGTIFTGWNGAQTQFISLPIDEQRRWRDFRAASAERRRGGGD
ncbi:AAA family ATPase [Ferrimonas balearica]|uniref:replicative DNA helicase n=1 Tax=Ferrimonas balearica TaxID=44012 RepID=UPI001C9763E8|nr:DnaB-like helicase C-terminal domain-containing protein [Ferrimonas balearica]MBY6104985.1 AAA family ATPase [Ferrimonas balearica]